MTLRHHWRLDDSRIAVERLPAAPREFDRSFADEVAIDFPALGDTIERMQHAFLESDLPVDRLHAEITLSRRQAGAGTLVVLEVPVRRTCRGCGGRGEVWQEPCAACAGSGHALHRQTLTVSVPAGVADGASFSFCVSQARGPRTLVDLHVAVT